MQSVRTSITIPFTGHAIRSRVFAYNFDCRFTILSSVRCSNGWHSGNQVTRFVCILFFAFFALNVNQIKFILNTHSISPRYLMLIGMITQIILGCSTGLVDNYNLHMFFRYLAAVCCALMYTPGLMICKFCLCDIHHFAHFHSIDFILLSHSTKNDEYFSIVTHVFGANANKISREH